MSSLINYINKINIKRPHRLMTNGIKLLRRVKLSLGHDFGALGRFKPLDEYLSQAVGMANNKNGFSSEYIVLTNKSN